MLDLLDLFAEFPLTLEIKKILNTIGSFFI